ncbi:MAG: hypothetical protein IPJ71_12525 [Bdellovibrionales bacterium]|nr:hypothetical protein [Bdellovibrionales bacterium]
MKEFFIYVIILSASISEAKVSFFVVDEVKKGILPCTETESPDYAAWRKLVFDIGEERKMTCARSPKVDYLVECHKGKSKKGFVFVGSESLSECESERTEKSKQMKFKLVGDTPKPKSAETNYFWKKSSFGEGCVDIAADAKMFREMCKTKSSSSSKLILDCTNVPDMTMKGIDLYSSENECEADK